MAAGGTRAVADGIYAGPGFVPFGLQAVVKFGGSLMRDVGLAAARAVIARGGLPVLLPSALVLALDVFTRKDVITSDTIGAYFAFLVGAPLYVVLTDVDGVYRGRGDGDPGTLVREISAGEL